jgi:26S proteasome regulatory subunit T5
MCSFEELARSTEDMNGAQLKAVCVEAGMVSSCLSHFGIELIVRLALRQNATQLTHEHFHG